MFFTTSRKGPSDSAAKGVPPESRWLVVFVGIKVSGFLGPELWNCVPYVQLGVHSPWVGSALCLLVFGFITSFGSGGLGLF